MSKSSGRRTRRVFNPEFKAKVALAALREEAVADGEVDQQLTAAGAEVGKRFSKNLHRITE